MATLLDPYTFSVSTTPPNCAEGTDGQITTQFQLPNNTPNVSHYWTNDKGDTIGTNTLSLSSLSADRYYFHVVFTNGQLSCESVELVDLTAPPPLMVQFSKTEPSCANELTGEISLTVNGGTPPYSYQWSNQAQTPQISQLGAGFYSFPSPTVITAV